jgi:hypothetical protein
MKRLSLYLLLSALLWANSSLGITTESFLSPFRAAHKETELLAGYAYSPLWDSSKPRFSYINTDLRRIWVLRDMHGELTPIRVVGGLFLARPVNSFGNYMAGTYVGLRYQWDLRNLPASFYVQGTLGALVTDAYEDRSQRLIGSFFEFREDLQLGLRVNPFTNKDCYLFLEAGVQHISNAGISRRNQGVNAATFNLGINLKL